MLAIRLQRVGRKKFPTYRVVISEKTKDPYADSLEILGSYNPHDKEKGLILKEDRVKYWLEKGAQTSETIFNLFLKLGLVKGDKKKSVFISKKRKGKLDVKNAEKLEKEKAAKEEAQAKKVEETNVKVEENAPIEEKSAEEPKTEEKAE